MNVIYGKMWLYFLFVKVCGEHRSRHHQSSAGFIQRQREWCKSSQLNEGCKYEMLMVVNVRGNIKTCWNFSFPFSICSTIWISHRQLNTYKLSVWPKMLIHFFGLIVLWYFLAILLYLEYYYYLQCYMCSVHPVCVCTCVVCKCALVIM